MTIKIMIERKFKENPKIEDIRIINDLRIKAMTQKGYVSGETLIETKDNRTMLVLSVWATLDDWEKWVDAPDRNKLEKKLSMRLAKPPQIRSFLLGADCFRDILTKA